MTPDQTFAYLDSNLNVITTAFPTPITVAAVAVKGWNSIVEVPATTTATTMADIQSSSISSPTIGSQTSVVSSTEPPDSSNSSGVHGGAAAGIFAGAFAAVALIGAGIYMFLRRRKSLATSDISGENSNVSELKSGQYVNVPQNPGHRLSELPTVSNTPELYTDYDPHSPRGNNMEMHELP